METFAKAIACWKQDKSKESAETLDSGKMNMIVHTRLRRERKSIFEYFWASFVWQVMVYAFACHFFVRFWGDWQVMLLSLSGVLVFIPFTAIFMRRFKSIARAGSMAKDMVSSVRSQRDTLAGFFRFKKGFDLGVLPLISLAIVIFIFRLYVPGGIEGHIVGAVITYAIVIAPFIIATVYENKKRFAEPLRRLEGILNDFAE